MLDSVTEKHIVYVLFAFAILSLLAACSPAVDPTPTSPTPMEKPTDITPSTPTPKPSDETVAFQKCFEETLDCWQEGADVPEDPARAGQPIAERLVVSHATVKFHVSNILSKLGVDSRTEAVILALQHNL